MRYEDVVRKICGDHWRQSNQEERDGAFGVACVLAFLEGCKASAEDFTRYLCHRNQNGEPDVTYDDIVIPFRRLQVSGIFSANYNAKKDPVLNAQNSSPESARTAWCIIAGTASGFVGPGYYITREVENQLPKNTNA